MAARQAVDAVLKGESLVGYSRSHSELRKAIEKWV
jgi:ribulose 1,5-bisphosphate carboxylase large subunit-like protein